MNLPALTTDPHISGAISRMMEAAPDDMQLIARWVGDIKSQQTVALGIDEAFALRDEQGEIQAYKQGLYLSKEMGTLIQPAFNSPFVISAQGYEVWADVAGASCIFPKEVLVNGEWKQNPFVERDPESKRLIAVHARATAFKHSAKGIPQVSDWTTIYDAPAYRLIDLLAKAKKCPQAFKLLPIEMAKPEDKGTWAKYPFDEATCLWVNTAHDDALTWFSQILNREKKAIDFAQTFAKRNSLKHLSGLQKAPGPEWSIPVVCWRPMNGSIIKWDSSQYSALQDRVVNMIEGDTGSFAAGAIELKTGKERTTEDANFSAMEAATDPEDQADVIDIAPQKSEPATEEPPAPVKPEKEKVVAQVAPTRTPEEEKVFANLRAAADFFEKEYAAAIEQHGEPTTVAEAEAVYKTISALADQHAEDQ